jgi:restriction system protein
MDLSEYTLLNRPALMLTVLKSASRDAVTLEDCLRQLRQDLACVKERAPPVDVKDLLAYLDGLKCCLMEAALLTPAEGRRFIATKRGRELLAEHPAGIDESVLMRFPEFRAFIERSARHPPPEDPRSDQYDEGYAAHEAGLSPVDNPYPSDTINHLAWENGWFEARDEEAEHEPATVRGEAPLRGAC